MAHLFEPYTLRGITLRNRIGVSPMCQFSSSNGFVNDWHLVHIGSRAVGGAGLVIMEAAAVVPEGRIAPSDLGIWRDAHIPGLKRIVDFVTSQGAVPGVQLAHAGRKASRMTPWEHEPKAAQGRVLKFEEGGWETSGPSPLPFGDGHEVPHSLTTGEIREVVANFVAAAERADQAGFEWLEVHAAHGYLLHSFCSPISNQRTDEYGGSLENRSRLTREVARALRAHWPEKKVLSFRLSYTDWAEGGWTLDDTVQMAKWLKEDGVDLIDASSGGSTPKPNIPFSLGYQVPGAEVIRREAGIPTAAVGLIVEAQQADQIIRDGQADLVYLARELLRDPYWPVRAAITLGKCEQVRVPAQYNTAWARLGEFNNVPWPVTSEV